jgi:hypothetical protein
MPVKAAMMDLDPLHAASIRNLKSVKDDGYLVKRQ